MGNFNSTADIIPVDIPVNLMIVAGWYTGAKKTKDINVYNCTTGQINRLTWGMLERCSFDSLMKNPLENIYMISQNKIEKF